MNTLPSRSSELPLDPMFLARWSPRAFNGNTQSPTHHFDAGAAWSHIALQSHLLGYQAHAMAGILHASVHNDLAVPEHLSVEIGIAIGTVGNPEQLPDALRQREKPSDRLPLNELITQGSY